MPTILIVEDDLMIADMLEEILVDAGYTVCGIARTVSEAVALAVRHEPSLAVIDMRLADGGVGTDVGARLMAPRLAGHGRPGILYATGNISHTLLDAAHGDACLAKPYRPEDLLRSLEIVLDIVATGTTGRPLPRGLHVLSPASPAPLRSRHG